MGPLGGTLQSHLKNVRSNWEATIGTTGPAEEGTVIFFLDRLSAGLQHTTNQVTSRHW